MPSNIHCFRDCFCYLVSIIILILTIANAVITWYEALSFLLAYLVYCIAMSFNTRIETWAQSSLPVPASWKHPDGDDGRYSLTLASLYCQAQVQVQVPGQVQVRSQVRSKRSKD